MTLEELYKLIIPLKKRTWKPPEEYNEITHKKFYIAGCLLGIVDNDPIYQHNISIERLLRTNEFNDKDMWRQGNRQALTYRTNRIEENIRHYLWNLRRSGKINYCWEVFDRDAWDTIGYVSAKSPEEASQLAKMMYGALTPNLQIHQSPVFPMFSDRTEVFTAAMTKKINTFKSVIRRKTEEITSLNIEIEKLNTNIEFLMYNMSAFSPEEFPE